MKLSIIMPVYNEVKTVEKIIDIVERVSLPKAIKERELVIVDDCSNDGTRDLLGKLGKKGRKFLFHDKNKGKGAALQTGFKNCTGDIVLIQDADLEYDPGEYPRLLEPILDDKADVVYGSRFMGGGPHRILYYWHSLGNKMLTLLSNMFSDLNLTDMETCYKVFRKEIIDQVDIEENRFGFEPEITAKIARMVRESGVRVYEIGISYYGRTYDEGKKIGMKDAVRAAWCVFKYNTSRFAHFVKYGINGVLVALSQFLILIALVEGFRFESNVQKNIAHAISVESAIIVAFFLHSFITWRYSYKKVTGFLLKLFTFNMLTAVSFAIRVGVFYLLHDIAGLHYIPSTLIGISAAVILNFFGYDRIIFKRIRKDI
jgi:glycosyltransferase involved in cell wall biosynthesis